MQERKQLFRLGDNMIALFPADALKAFPINFETLWATAAGAAWAGSDLRAKLSAAENDAAYLVDNGSLMNVVSKTAGDDGLITAAVVRWVISMSSKIVIKQLTVVDNNATLATYDIADTVSGGASILLTGYIKAGAYSAVVPEDTIVSAVGKLEAGLNALQTQVGNEDSGLEKLLKDFIATKAQANGLASLDSAGKVPAAQLPSFVDDVVEVTFVDSEANIPTSGLILGQKFYAKDVKQIFEATSETAHGAGSTPETGKIYVDMNPDGQYGSNITYRWSGSQMVEISQSLALGETEDTAYTGARGKENRAAIVSLPDEIVSAVDAPTPSKTNLTFNFKKATKSGINYGAPAAATITIPAATADVAGVMTAKDKKNLDAVLEAMGGDPTNPDGGDLTPDTADFLKKSDAGVGILKDYAEAIANTKVAANDTINVAVGKLQKQLNDAESGTTSPVVPEIPEITVPDVPEDNITNPFPEDSKPVEGDDLKTIIAKLQAQVDYLTKQIVAINGVIRPDGYQLVYVAKE